MWFPIHIHRTEISLSSLVGDMVHVPGFGAEATGVV
jgi:hypothetical protein